jgi:uncharacterized protein YecE (DUF72 family)
MHGQASIRIGTSGWSYKHWLGSFYDAREKPASYLATYSRHFNTTEINNTFYRLPSKEAVREWHDTVPDGFTFAVKASRYMTHLRKLKEPEEPLSRMLDSVSGLGAKQGPFLVQCPPNWRRNIDRLEHFLDALPKEHKFAFEFRDPSWFDEGVYELLRAHGAALCVYDLEGHVSPAEITANWVYLRFHKPKGENNWHYNGELLASWAETIVSWARNGYSVYCYFNNDLDGAAPRNAKQMIDLVKERMPE